MPTRRIEGEARKAGELRLLDLQRQREGADLDLILATKATSSAEWANASARKDQLDAIYAQRADAIGRSNEGPAASYMRVLNRSAGAIDEDVQSGAVDALKDLNTGLTDAIMGTAKLADAFQNMGRRIIASLIDIMVQQRLIKPLAAALLGTGASNTSFLSRLGSTLGLTDSNPDRTASEARAEILSGTSLIGGIANIAMPTFAGFRAKGGSVGANDWVVVGENGPEVFAPGVAGTVIPNGGRGNRTSGGIAHIVPSPYFDVRVDGRVARGSAPIAQATMATGMGEAARASAWRSRQTLA